MAAAWVWSGNEATLAKSDDMFDKWMESVEGIAKAIGCLQTKVPQCPGEPGDMIEFRRGRYSHWAINAGNNEVIHLIGDGWGSFTSATIGTMIPQVRYESFAVVDQDAKSGKGKKLKGSIVRVNNTSRDYLPKALPPQAIVERALSQVGEKGYHLMYNNCEHFTTWSRHGKGHSKQVLKGTFHKPKPSGGTREEVDSQLGYLRNADRHTWAVVMTGKEWYPTGVEKWQLWTEFPIHKLEDWQKKGERISVVGNTSKKWFISLRSRSLTDDKHPRVKLFGRGLHPKDTIKKFEKWISQRPGKGQILTKVGCHGGILAAVAEKKQRDERGQLYTCQGEFNTSVIQQAWREGRKVLAIAYFNSWWIVVTSTHRVQGKQVGMLDNRFPEQMIRKYWDEGYRIQAMAAGPQWVIIMLKTENSAQMKQSYRLSQDEFPREFVQDNWHQEMVITAVTGN